jgi:hypothetical protein
MDDNELLEIGEELIKNGDKSSNVIHKAKITGALTLINYLLGNSDEAHWQTFLNGAK